ncbi:MAG: hypothetical protein Kow0077_17470 [Anaerolineae bacterium]
METTRHTNKHYKRSRAAQSGQVIILMAFGMIALLAVLGLAIDGGRLYFLERDAQNATDAAAVAATYALCTNGDPVTAGTNAALENGFFTDGSSMTVTINNPPTRPLQSSSDPNTFAEVIITTEIPSYFIHLVYGGDLTVSTYALGHCIPGWDPFNDGGAIVSINSEGCSCQNPCSVTTSDNDIFGNVRCNGEVKSQGSDHEINGNVDYMCNYSANNMTLNPSTNNPTLLPERFEVPEFYDINDFRPGGYYYNLAQANGDLWAFTGGGNHKINLNRAAERARFAAGGLIYSDGNLQILGSGTHTSTVTIVSEGSINISSDTNLTAHPDYSNPGGDGVGHLLMFTAVDGGGCNKNNNVSITYSSTRTVWSGIIYAPKANVDFSNSRSYGEGAIIADTISISGSDNEIHYRPIYLPPQPPSIQLEE